MTNLEFLPTLSKGRHDPGSGEACLMEYVSLLAGEPWSDSPACTHPVLATVARQVNDRLPDGERQRLVPLIGRLFGTAPTGSPLDQQVLGVRLAVWAARRVLPVGTRHQSVCVAAIDAAERWCNDPTAENACAAEAAYAAAEAVAYSIYTGCAAFYATRADAAATRAAAAAARAAACAIYAAAYAARAAAADAARADASAADAAHVAADPVAFLTGLLGEYDRLTGRNEHRTLTDDDLRQLTTAVTR